MHTFSTHSSTIRTGVLPAPDRSKRLGFSLVLASLLSPSYASAATESDPRERGTLASKRGTYVVEYVAEPSPIPLNAMFGLQVTVRERHKQGPTKRVTLEVDAGMLAHNHGMNVLPKVARLPDGTFRVTGMLFHMRGEWHLTFVIKRGLLRDRAETDLVVE